MCVMILVYGNLEFTFGNVYKNNNIRKLTWCSVNDGMKHLCKSFYMENYMYMHYFSQNLIKSQKI